MKTRGGGSKVPANEALGEVDSTGAGGRIQGVKLVGRGIPWTIWVGGMGLSLVAGFGVGRVTAPAAQSTGKPAAPVETGGEAPEVPVDEKGSALTAQSFSPSSSMESLQQALGMTNPKTRDREMENALSRATLQEVKQALEWAATLPESAAKRALLGKILERWGQLDGVNAAAYGERIFAETGNPQLLKDAVRGWGQSDPNGAMQYAQSTSLGDGIKRDLSRDLLRDWADRTPEAAAAYAAANRIEVGRGGAMAVIADRWSKQDPRAAAQWALSLPAGRDQQRALDLLVQNWSDLSLQAAADFVTRQPAGANKEIMVGSLAREVAKQDTSAALQWASTLNEPEMQSRTALSFMWRSARQDLGSARQMVNASALSPEAKQAVLSKMTNGYGGGRGGP